MKSAQLKELVLQSLEHERGGIQIYTTALECAVNKDLHHEWSEYLEQTKGHAKTLEKVCETLGYDPEEPTPGRKVVKHTGTALVEAMKMALAEGDKHAAELVAADCVVLAETKDHANWELLGKCAEQLGGEKAAALKAAYDKIEDEEDEHLYHSKGWGRELWLKSLGLAAVLPPPEEVKDVKSAIAAARAQKESEKARRH
jgi:ferritin-like metal-binding protein YciE